MKTLSTKETITIKAGTNSGGVSNTSTLTNPKIVVQDPIRN